MTRSSSFRDSVATFAERFRVRLVRSLPSSAGTSRWLVRDINETSGVAPADGGADLFELIVLHESTDDDCDARLCFLELHSDEQSSGGALQDVCIDPELGMALVLTYQPSLDLAALRAQQVLSAGECATVLLAVIAFGVRARAMGYCLGEISPQQLLVDELGSVRAQHAKGMHACAEGDQECCVRGIALSALAHVASVVSGTAGEHLAAALIHQLHVVAPNDHPLEVAVHTFTGEVTPKRLRLITDIRNVQTSEPEPIQGALANHSHQRSRAEVALARLQAYIPRLASNAPSSRRVLTWVRNRAASAPSTMR